MNLLHASMQGSCEFLIDSQLVLIRYNGGLTFDFILECVGKNPSNGDRFQSQLFLIDFRNAHIMMNRDELKILAEQIKRKLPQTATISFLVDKPLETALIYLFCQHLDNFDAKIFTTPESAFAAFTPRANNDLYQSEIYRKVCID